MSIDEHIRRAQSRWKDEQARLKEEQERERRAEEAWRRSEKNRQRQELLGALTTLERKPQRVYTGRGFAGQRTAFDTTVCDWKFIPERRHSSMSISGSERQEGDVVQSIQFLCFLSPFLFHVTMADVPNNNFDDFERRPF